MHFLLLEQNKQKQETNVQKETCSACLESPMFLFNHYHIKILCTKKLHV